MPPKGDPVVLESLAAYITPIETHQTFSGRYDIAGAWKYGLVLAVPPKLFVLELLQP